MRALLVVVLLLAVVPGAAAEPEVSTASTSSDTDATYIRPDPPPGSPCRPTCHSGTDTG